MKLSPCVAFVILFGGGGVVAKHVASFNEIEKGISLKIINGAFTTIEEFPSDVSFLVENNIWGVGVILNKNWILTLAFNCFWVDPSFISVRVGSSYWNKQGKVFQTVKCIMHPSYKGNWAYNIALLKVDGNITLGTNTTKIAKLPAKSVQVGSQLPVTGWGVRSSNYTKESQLQKTKQTVLSVDDCSRVYNLTGTDFCANNNISGPCVFDFGAPLLKTRTVVGLYQGSMDCTRPDLYPALYTDVFQFKEWIQQTMAANRASVKIAVDEQGE